MLRKSRADEMGVLHDFIRTNPILYSSKGIKLGVLHGQPRQTNPSHHNPVCTWQGPLVSLVIPSSLPQFSHRFDTLHYSMQC